MGKIDTPALIMLLMDMMIQKGTLTEQERHEIIKLSTHV